MEIVAEEWRPVAGKYAGWPYEVSSMGNVRNARNGYVLKQWLSSWGYPRVNIRSAGGKACCIEVHRLVAFAFHGSPAHGMQVNHKDGRKENNTASNLEWVTDSENKKHAWRLGLYKFTENMGASGHRFKRGEKHPLAKLNEQKAAAIRTLTGRGVTPSFLARWFGVDRSAIHQVVSRKTYAYL